MACPFCLGIFGRSLLPREYVSLLWIYSCKLSTKIAFIRICHIHDYTWAPLTKIAQLSQLAFSFRAVVFHCLNRQTCSSLCVEFINGFVSKEKLTISLYRVCIASIPFIHNKDGSYITLVYATFFNLWWATGTVSLSYRGFCPFHHPN